MATNGSIEFSAPSNGSFSWSAPYSTTTTSGVRYSPSPSVGQVNVSAITDVAINYSQQYEIFFGTNPSTAGRINTTSSWFNPGVNITISETANPGYQFQTWSSSSTLVTVTDSSASETLISVNGTATITAAYVTSLTISTSGGGSVFYSSGLVNGSVTSGGSLTIYLPPASVVVLTAVPNSGYVFSSWTGQPSGSPSSLSPIDFVLNSPLTIAASFSQSSISQSSTSTSISSSSHSNSFSSTQTSTLRH